MIDKIDIMLWIKALLSDGNKCPNNANDVCIDKQDATAIASFLDSQLGSYDEEYQE